VDGFPEGTGFKATAVKDWDTL